MRPLVTVAPDQTERDNFNRLRRAHDDNSRGPAVHVAIPDLADPCYLRLTESICRAAEGYGATIRLTVTRCDRQREAEAAAVCEVSDGIGLILVSAGTIPDHTAERCRIVGIGPIASGPNLPVISTGKDRAISTAVEHLASLGHTSVRFLHCGLSYAADEARQLFLRAASEQGIGEEACFVDLNDHRSLDGTVQAAERGEVTAVLVSDDTVAAHLVDDLRTHDVRVPLDVSVSGFNKCDQKAPGSGLTTVDLLDETIANVVVDALCRGRAPEPGDYSPRLVVAATTGYVPRTTRARCAT